ncbi:hypothetical protein L5F46_05735 [Aliarcobacter butzleri]|uniref:hypothetical protein n=1 Tax=Aliarcobacter butzleri TaxID=28197 RepID=UPI001EE02D50|nr:hypothetical protein [Aliarcobacter butzleri]MCG3674275.1 hypothetical protein [Aliarcobacter butzleri]
MKNSLNVLHEIDKVLLGDVTYYEFNSIEKNLSKKYRKGRINASRWLSELIFMFIQKESNFLLEFKELILQQKIKLNSLKDGDFKTGLLDELNAIEDMINDRINCISSIFFIIAVLLVVFVIEKSKEKGKIPFDDRLK